MKHYSYSKSGASLGKQLQKNYFGCSWSCIFSCPGSSIPDLGQSVSQWVSHCHFRNSTQIVTFETWDPSDIWSEWCPDKKKKDRKTKRQNDKRQRPKREFNIVTSGQFRTLAMFFCFASFFVFVIVTFPHNCNNNDKNNNNFHFFSRYCPLSSQ